MPPNDLDELLSPEEIEKQRLKRETSQRKSSEVKSIALARKFDEGISILSAPENEDGRRKIKLSKFIEVLAYDLEKYSEKIDLNFEEEDYIRKYMSKLAVGSGSLVVMKCAGKSECFYGQDCPFADLGKEPLNSRCPHEYFLFNEILIRYMTELDVDPTNIMEVSYCNELAETEILIMRMNRQLARRDNSKLIMVQTTTIRNVTTTVTEVSPYLEAREKLVKRRERVIKLMVGDRQEKYKRDAALKTRRSDDPSIQQAKARARILEVQMEEKKKEIEVSQTTFLTPDDILKE